MYAVLALCAPQPLHCMDFIKKLFSCVFCLDSYNIETFENNATETNLCSSSEVTDPIITPRLITFFYQKTEKTLLRKYPSLAFGTQKCIEECSLYLLEECLNSYTQEHNPRAPEQKTKILIMLSILLQEKENFPKIKNLMQKKYRERTVEKNVVVRFFFPGKSDIFAYALAVYQTQLKYIKPYKHPVKLLLENNNSQEKPIQISLFSTNQETIGAHNASLILQFLGDNFNYKLTNMIAPLNRRYRLRPAPLIDPLLLENLI